jgi:ABC-type phosphate transport system ATPase subunit
MTNCKVYPISTLKIEELMQDLKKEYTGVPMPKLVGHA